MTAPQKLKSYMVYLDPHDPDDRTIINHLRPLIKRRKVSNEIREALLIYIAYLRRKKEPDSAALATDLETPPTIQAMELPPTVNEAARTFIKRRA